MWSPAVDILRDDWGKEGENDMWKITNFKPNDEVGELGKLALQAAEKSLKVLVENRDFDHRQDARQTLRLLKEIGFLEENDFFRDMNCINEGTEETEGIEVKE